MRRYELLLILRPNLDEAASTSVVENIGELIQRNEGTITKTQVWGRRRLAYPLDNQHEATYILLKTTIPPINLSDIEFNLKLNEPLLRYLLVRDNDPEVAELTEATSNDATANDETVTSETEVAFEVSQDASANEPVQTPTPPPVTDDEEAA